MYSLLFALVTLMSDPPGLRSFTVTYKYKDTLDNLQSLNHNERYTCTVEKHGTRDLAGAVRHHLIYFKFL